ncbi:MAG: NAD(P)/FAD-dependent oxidoreductase [Alphaproteobacteria bacterium]|nr:NAD(P)/FAD-dependent oxidoreductase [Alphaproteobacteria bacterium]
MSESLTQVAQKAGMKLPYDPDTLKQKYMAERDRRIRADGNSQYREITGEFAHFVDDPYVEPGFTRAPLQDEVDVIVIGGGFGGLLAGARLREAGVKKIRMIDRAGDFGGTWYWNRYPGAACDIESYIYLPLLEELNYVPKEKYSQAPEILAHSQAIGRKFDLYDDALFQTEVTGMNWDAKEAKWTVTTNRGDAMKARFVAMSNGPLNKPKLPGMTGIEKFNGHTFHTSRWDYNYTGGNSLGGLTGLADKRVAIIGTGATAVQCVPHLGKWSKHLYVFQRTPSSVDVRNNRPTDAQWANSLEKGWQKNRMDNFNVLVSGGSAEVDLVGDGWTDIFRKLTTIIARQEPVEKSKASSAEMAMLSELADQQKMEEVRARAAAIVKDPKVAEALKPYYRQFCKRPCFHDEYLPTYNLPNVTLVDTLGKGVDRITEKGIMFAGREYEVDCIIFATGFEVNTDYTSRSGYDIVGRDQNTLSKKWANGLSTYHGFYSNGFPNCFFMGMTQTGITANIPHMLNEQAKHISYVIKHAMGHNIRAVEPTVEAEAAWVAEIRKMASVGERFYAECTPGYYNNEGKPKDNGNGFLNGQYGGGPVTFFKILEDWRNEGELRGLEVS